MPMHHSTAPIANDESAFYRFVLSSINRIQFRERLPDFSFGLISRHAHAYEISEKRKRHMAANSFYVYGARGAVDQAVSRSRSHASAGITRWKRQTLTSQILRGGAAFAQQLSDTPKP